MMSEPVHDLCQAFYSQPLGQFRPLDHDDRQTQFARRIDLGARARAAGVAGDDPCDGARTHQRQLAGKREGSSRHDQIGIRQRQRAVSGIDEAERVGVLRLHRKRRDVLPPDGEKNIRAGFRQCGHCGGNVIHLDPDIARLSDPRLALKCHQRRFRFRAGDQHVATDPGCEGMRCIDHTGELFLPDELGKPAHAAKAANACRQRLIDRNLRSTRIGIDRVEPSSRNCGCQQIGFARSAQDEDAHG